MACEQRMTIRIPSWMACEQRMPCAECSRLTELFCHQCIVLFGCRDVGRQPCRRTHQAVDGRRACGGSFCLALAKMLFCFSLLVVFLRCALLVGPLKNNAFAMFRVHIVGISSVEVSGRWR